MVLEISSAVDLFGTLFQLSIWAAGFICIAYMFSVLRIFAQHVKQIRFGGR